MKKQDLIIPDAPLKMGARGIQVDNLQAILKYILKYKKEPEPSYYGRFTEDKVKVIQENLGIRISGVYDNMTRSTLREALHGNNN